MLVIHDSTETNELQCMRRVVAATSVALNQIVWSGNFLRTVVNKL